MGDIRIVTASRRRFLKAGAGLTLAVYLSPALAEMAAAGPGQAGGKGAGAAVLEPNPFGRIGRDISSPEDLPQFKRLLGDGSQWGIRFDYEEQSAPRGLADAFRVGKGFIGGDRVCLVLGDNILYGTGLWDSLRKAAHLTHGARIFAYPVREPDQYGVVEFDAKGSVINLEEKPKQPKSHYAVTGLYFYDQHVIDYAKSLKPSVRNELEITDLNRIYLERSALRVEIMGRGYAWLDTGTHESLLDASQFVALTLVIDHRLGIKVYRVDDGRIYIREDLKLISDANIISIGGYPVGNHPITNLILGERLDHVLLARHFTYPVVGLQSHNSSSIITTRYFP